MADLHEVERFARQMMNEYGLGHWGFEFDKATQRFGCCHFDHRKITLSKRLVEANSEAQAVDTVLHEIAHALVGWAADHGPVWQAKAREIGAKPEACYTADDGVVLVGKYKGYCAFCGPDPLVARQRMPTQRLSCRKHNEPIQWRNETGHVIDPTAIKWEVTCPACGPLASLYRKPGRGMVHRPCGNKVNVSQDLGILS